MKYIIGLTILSAATATFAEGYMKPVTGLEKTLTQNTIPQRPRDPPIPATVYNPVFAEKRRKLKIQRDYSPIPPKKLGNNYKGRI